MFDFEHRLRALERGVGDINRQINETGGDDDDGDGDDGDDSTQVEYLQQNFLRNGDLDFDRNRYLYTADFSDADAGTVDADVSLECAHWYTSVPSTGAPFLFSEDATDANADADNATNTTLKHSTHSRHSSTINDPDWDKTTGQVRIGSTNWLVAPFHQNLIRASNQYFITFLYKMAATIGGSSTYQIPFFVGLYDNSSGIGDFIKGDDITLSASPVGGSGTSYDYMIVFERADNTTFSSTVETVSGPAVFVTNTAYVDLSWTNHPKGVIRAKVYRRQGSNVYYVGNAYPAQTFRDQTNSGTLYSSGGTFPTTTFAEKEAAFFQTHANGSPDYELATASTSEWKVAQISLVVPETYNFSLTSGKQWFVLGLQTSLGTARVVLIDKISIDDKFGVFSRCPLDFLAARQPSITPTTGDQGTTGTTPPFDPGGTGECPTFEMPVEVESRKTGERFEIAAIDLVDNEHLYKIVNRQGIAVKYRASVSAAPQTIYELRDAINFKRLSASESHPCFRTDEDSSPLALAQFLPGDSISMRSGNSRVLTNLRQKRKRHTVKITLLEGTEKGFWINGFACHNLAQKFI